MSESASTESSKVIYDFLARRYAQIFVDKFVHNRDEAEEWIRTVIPESDVPKIKPYVLQELKNRGYTGVS